MVFLVTVALITCNQVPTLIRVADGIFSTEFAVQRTLVLCVEADSLFEVIQLALADSFFFSFISEPNVLDWPVNKQIGKSSHRCSNRHFFEGNFVDLFFPKAYQLFERIVVGFQSFH